MIDHAFPGKITDAVYQLVRYWKMRQEIKRFKSCRKVHELPAIFHYWSNKYLVPKFLPIGFANPTEFFHLYMMRCCRRFRGENCRFISIGSGNCDLETELARILREVARPRLAGPPPRRAYHSRVKQQIFMALGNKDPVRESGFPGN